MRRPDAEEIEFTKALSGQSEARVYETAVQKLNLLFAYGHVRGWTAHIAEQIAISKLFTEARSRCARKQHLHLR